MASLRYLGLGVASSQELGLPCIELLRPDRKEAYQRLWLHHSTRPTCIRSTQEVNSPTSLWNTPDWQPRRYYFHMSKLEDPDEDGGIVSRIPSKRFQNSPIFTDDVIKEPKTGVSFIIAPARKGVQAIAVKIADPPKEEEKNENGAETSAAGGGFGDGFDDDSGVPSAGDNAGDDAGWGTFGDWVRLHRRVRLHLREGTLEILLVIERQPCSGWTCGSRLKTWVVKFNISNHKLSVAQPNQKLLG